MKLANNGTCPAGTVECGMRPAKEVPTGSTPTAGGGKTSLNVPAGLLQQDNLLAKNVSLPAFYKLGFKLTPRGVKKCRANIIQFSKNDDQSVRKQGEAIPSIYFDSYGYTIRFYYQVNEGSRYMNSYYAPFVMAADVEYDMEIRIMPEGSQILVDGVIYSEGAEDRGTSTNEAIDNVRVWTAGGRTDISQNICGAALAEMSGLWISGLSGDEEFPLMPPEKQFRFTRYNGWP